MTYDEFVKVTDFHYEYMEFMEWFDIVFSANDSETFRIRRLKDVIIFVYKCLGENGCNEIMLLEDDKGTLHVKLKREFNELKIVIDAAWIANREHDTHYSYRLPF